MYTKQEMENMEKECVQFITEFLKRIKNIIIGKTAGFCYGVKRAVDGVNKDIKENKEDNIYCLGEIVHNRQVINSLKEMRSANESTALEHHPSVSDTYLNSLGIAILKSLIPFFIS